MTFTASQLPVFVYGTLRRGQGNHRVLTPHAVAIHDAELAGHRLYSSGLPYVSGGGLSDVVIGELVTLNPSSYDRVMARLDVLEGVRHGLYLREQVQVRFRCGTGRGRAGRWRATPAWVYLGGAGFRCSPDLVVPGGDWVSAVDRPLAGV